MAEPRDLTSILDVLLAEQVSFVLVGALAAVDQGAPLMTQDVDIVHARTPENLDRLMTALGKLNARCRGRPLDNPLRPARRALASTGHSLFMTDLGPLGCLGAIEEGRDYDVLVSLSVELDLDGRRMRVLGLEAIVEIKRASRLEKDRIACRFSRQCWVAATGVLE